MSDIRKVYHDLNVDAKISKAFYNAKKGSREYNTMVSFLKQQEIPVTDEALLALAIRIVDLKERKIKDELERLNFSKEQINQKIIAMEVLVQSLYDQEYVKTYLKIKEENLLHELYQTIIKHSVFVGQAVNELHVYWRDYVNNVVNVDLTDRFEKGELCIDGKKASSVKEFLSHKGLLDKIGEKDAPFCYSVLQIREHEKGEFMDKEGCHFDYVSATYKKAFPLLTIAIIRRLETFLAELEEIKCENYSNDIEKNTWVKYISSLITALNEEDPTKAIQEWSLADIAWMEITSPIQICHFFEYYDDSYRNGVAPEWDIRIQGLHLKDSMMKEPVKEYFISLCEEMEFTKFPMYETTINNINRTKLFQGRKLFYFGSGLISKSMGQVLPNSEQASKAAGKKIFSFPEAIYAVRTNDPVTLLNSKTLEESFLEKWYTHLFGEPEEWFRQFDIKTIGHEFGHNNGKGETTEEEMNVSGVFKLIEEWKATVSGFLGYFLVQEKYDETFVMTLVMRMLETVLRKNIPEARPYYCEGLIHLNALCYTNIVSFTGEKVHVDITEEKFDLLKRWYAEIYYKAMEYYAYEEDPKVFLNMFLQKEGETYMPRSKKQHEFVTWYLKMNKEFGNTIDPNFKKEKYLVTV